MKLVDLSEAKSITIREQKINQKIFSVLEWDLRKQSMPKSKWAGFLFYYFSCCISLVCVVYCDGSSLFPSYRILLLHLVSSFLVRCSPCGVAFSLCLSFFLFISTLCLFRNFRFAFMETLLCLCRFVSECNFCWSSLKPKIHGIPLQSPVPEDEKRKSILLHLWNPIFECQERGIIYQWTNIDSWPHWFAFFGAQGNLCCLFLFSIHK